MPYENFEGDLIRPVKDSIKDGDTLAMKSEIRMVAIDTPETKFSLVDTKQFDSKLSLSNSRMRDFLDGIHKPLRDYLKPKIRDNDKRVGTNQHQKGILAKEKFNSLVSDAMGARATNLILMTSVEVTDRYGRLLGYVNRKKKPSKGEVLTETVKFEDSFNMKMLETGYAFMYLIYPNLVVGKDNPDDLATPDLQRPLIKATVSKFKKAISNKQGLFKSGKSSDPDIVLDPFEFRYLARIFDKSATGKGPDRLCADMKTRKLHPADRYFEVPRENRLFFGKDQKKLAIKKGYKWVGS